MELEERIWGKAYIVFKDAVIKYNGNNIEDECWLYDEVYKVNEKYEINILFDKSEIDIICNEAYISIEDKAYFKDLYKVDDYNIELDNNNKKDIANTVLDKELLCGYSMLNQWELLIYSFIQIYSHINYYKYNNVNKILESHYYNLSVNEYKRMYVILFETLEKKLISSIKVLKQNQKMIKEDELDNIVNEFSAIYDRKDITMEAKNQLYLDIDATKFPNLTNLYRKILISIDENLIN